MTTKLPPLPLADFSYGLNDTDDASLIPSQALAVVENFMLGRGFLQLWHGYSKYTPNALPNPIRQLYTFYKNDGTNEFLAISNNTLYKDIAGALTAIGAYNLLTLEDCEDVWNETTSANTTVTLDATDKKVGTNSVKLAVTAAAVAGELLATEAILSTDISVGTQVALWIKSSVSTVAGGLQLLLDNTASCASPVHALPVPALVANTWTQVTIPYDGTVAGSNAIISVGLKYVTDLGACSIWIDQVEVRIPVPLSSSDTEMATYKNRSLQDVVLIADGGKLKVYDPSAAAVIDVKPHTPTTDEQTDPGLNDLANLTNFRAIAIKQDRVFALAHDKTKNRISFCHRDPNLGYAVFDYWPATHFYDMVSELNDESITLRTFRNAIIVFNRRSLWILIGDGRTQADYQLHRINVPSGLLAPDSVAYVGNFIFYLSDVHVYAIYSTDRDYISAEIASRDIENTLKSIPLEDRKKAVGAFHDGKYYLSFPGGKTLVLDTMLPSPMNKYGAWMVRKNVQANSFLERDGVLYFSSDNGRVFKFDPQALNDDGTVITGLIRTKRNDYGYPVQIKKFKRFWIVAKQYDANSSKFNFSVIIDEIRKDIEDISTDESLVWDEGNWDESTWDFKDVVQKRLRVSERGKTIQYEITHDTLDEPLTVYQIVALAKLKKAR